MAENRTVTFSWDAVEGVDGYNIYIRQGRSSIFQKQNQELLTQLNYQTTLIAASDTITHFAYVEAVKGDRISIPSRVLQIRVDGDFLFFEQWSDFEGSKGSNWIDPNNGNSIGTSGGISRVKISWEDDNPLDKYIQQKYVPASQGTERINYPFEFFRFRPEKAATLEYDLYFETIWDFRTQGDGNQIYADTGFPFQTGKIHGLSPHEDITVVGGSTPNPEGWSLRVTWLRDTSTHNLDPSDPNYVSEDTDKFLQENKRPTLSIYSHGQSSNSPNQYPILKSNVSNGFEGLERHKWYKVKLHVQLNDEGLDNGLAKLEIWDRDQNIILGSIYTDHLRLRDIDTERSRIRMLRFDTTWGGSNTNWSPPHSVDIDGNIELDQKEFTDSNGISLHVFNDNLVETHNGLFNRISNFKVSSDEFLSAPEITSTQYDTSTSETTIRFRSNNDWSTVTGIQYRLEDGDYDQNGWTTYAGTVNQIGDTREILLTQQNENEEIRLRLIIGDRFSAKSEKKEYGVFTPEVSINLTSHVEGSEISPGDQPTYEIALSGDTELVDRIEYDFNGDIENVAVSPYSISKLHTNIESLGDFPITIKAYTDTNFVLGERTVTLEMKRNLGFTFAYGTSGFTSTNKINIDNPIPSFNWAIDGQTEFVDLTRGSIQIDRLLYLVDSEGDSTGSSVHTISNSTQELSGSHSFFGSTYSDVGDRNVRVRIRLYHEHMVNLLTLTASDIALELMANPIINQYSVQETSTAQATISWDISKRNASITDIQYRVDGGIWTTTNSTNIQDSFVINDLPSGSRTIDINVISDGDDVIDSGTVSISEEPTISTYDASFDDKEINHSYSITDNSSTITSIQYLVIENNTDGSDDSIIINWTDLGSQLINSGTIAHNDIINGQRYDVVIRINYTIGTSSLLKTSTRTGIPAGLPIINNFQIIPEDGSVGLRYTLHSNGSDITNVEYRVDGGMWNALDVPNDGINVIRISQFNADNGVEYNVDFRVINSVGASSESGTVIPYGKPIFNWFIVDEQDKSVTISWDIDPNGRNLDSLEYCVDNTCTPLTISNTGTQTISNLINGGEYNISMKATNLRGTTEPSVLAIPFGLPIIEGFVLTPGDTVIEYAYSASRNGRPITVYTQLNNNTPVNVGTSTSSGGIISALDNGTEYTVTLIVENEAGQVSQFELETPAGAPIIEQFSVIAGDASADYSYTINPNGATTTVYYQVNNQTPVLIGTEPSGSGTISGLTNDQQSTIKLIAENYVGSVDQSSIVTPEADVEPTNISPIITNVSEGDQQLSVSWSYIPTEPIITSVEPLDNELRINVGPLEDTGGSPITNYEYSINGGTWQSSGSSSSPIDTSSNLTNGTTYNVKVRAVNSVGTFFESNEVQGTPEEPAILVETQNYITRVTNDGGTVRNEETVDQLYTYLTNNNLLNNLLLGFTHYAGFKGDIEKAYDLSGSNNDGIQTTAGLRPSIVSNAMRFNDDRLNIPLGQISSWTIISRLSVHANQPHPMLGRSANLGGSLRIQGVDGLTYAIDSGSGFTRTLPSSILNSYGVVGHRHGGGGSHEFFFNGSQYESGGSADIIQGDFIGFADSTRYADYSIKDLLVFNSGLTNQQITNIYNFIITT